MTTLRPIRPETAEKLSKVAGLLGSDLDGERSAAALAATKILKANGWCWRDLVERALRPGQDKAGATRAPPDPDLAERLDWLLARLDLLSDWEQGFVVSLSARRRPLTERQREKLAEVAERVEARAR